MLLSSRVVLSLSYFPYQPSFLGERNAAPDATNTGFLSGVEGLFA